MNLKFLHQKNKFLLLFACFCTGLFTLKTQAQNEIIVDRIIAKVDNKVILESELNRAVQDYRSQGTYISDQVKCQIFEQLLMSKVMVAKAAIDSVMVSDEEVNADLNQRFAMMVAQVGSEEKIKEYYNKSVDELKEELRESIHDQLVIRKMQSEITGAISVTPKEVKAFYHDIPTDSLPFYSTEVEVGQIVKKPILSEESKSAAEQKLFSIKSRIEKGEKFEDLAKIYSQDPGSARTGGDLGYRKRGELVPEFEAVAMTINEGEISDPIESDFGFHLIQLLERRGNEFHARHILVKPDFKQSDYDKASNFLDSLRSNILEDSIRTFEKQAKDNSEDKMTASSGGYFVGPANSRLISVEQLAPDVFFTIDTMKVGSITDPVRFKMQDGSEAMRILYYKKKQAPHMANYFKDYLKLQEATINSRKQAVTKEWFVKARKDVFIKIVPEYQSCINLGN